jgi:hypothetical protein
MATKIDEVALRWLRKALNGEAVLPGDPTYDDARTLCNGMTDRLRRCGRVDGPTSQGVDLRVQRGATEPPRNEGHRTIAGARQP